MSRSGGTGKPTLSLVIAAYNEEYRIENTLQSVRQYLNEHQPNHEILVVDDGSHDQTAAIVRTLQHDYDRLRLLRLERNQGQGAAIRSGITAARGEFVLISDADLATPIEEFAKLKAHLDNGADLATGSRALSTSVIRAHQPWFRRWMGKTFNLIVRSLLPISLRDTQCGFKLFRESAARAIFDQQRLNGFAFNVETLLLAQKLGLQVAEVPVTWFHVGDSKVSPILDSTQMFWDVVKLRARLRRS